MFPNRVTIATIVLNSDTYKTDNAHVPGASKLQTSPTILTALLPYIYLF